MKLRIAFERGNDLPDALRGIPARVVRVARILRGKEFVVGARFTPRVMGTPNKKSNMIRAPFFDA